jgi:hypothetical protein
MNLAQTSKATAESSEFIFQVTVAHISECVASLTESFDSGGENGGNIGTCSQDVEKFFEKHRQRYVLITLCFCSKQLLRAGNLWALLEPKTLCPLYQFHYSGIYLLVGAFLSQCYMK